MATAPSMQAVKVLSPKPRRPTSMCSSRAERRHRQGAVADALHSLSGRSDGPAGQDQFAPAIPETLLESELFGTNAARSPTAAAAKPASSSWPTGTLLLDEIAEMSPSLQAKLLARAARMDDSNVWGAPRNSRPMCALLAATHADIPQALADGKFRSDLYYGSTRSRFPLAGRLRDRRDDIPLLPDIF